MVENMEHDTKYNDDDDDKIKEREYVSVKNSYIE